MTLNLNVSTATTVESLQKSDTKEVVEKFQKDTKLYKEVLRLYLTQPESFREMASIERALTHLVLDRTLQSVTQEAIQEIKKIDQIWMDKGKFKQVTTDDPERLKIYIALHDEHRIDLDSLEFQETVFIEKLKERGRDDLIKLLHEHKIYSSEERKIAIDQWINALYSKKDNLPELNAFGPFLNWDEILGRLKSQSIAFKTDETKMLFHIAYSIESQPCSEIYRVWIFEALNQLDQQKAIVLLNKTLKTNHLETFSSLFKLIYPEGCNDKDFDKYLSESVLANAIKIADYLIETQKPSKEHLASLYNEKFIQVFADITKPISDYALLIYLVRQNIPFSLLKYDQLMIAEKHQREEHARLDKELQKNYYAHQTKELAGRFSKGAWGCIQLGIALANAGASFNLEDLKILLANGLDPKSLPSGVSLPPEAMAHYLCLTIERTPFESTPVLIDIKNILSGLPADIATEVIRRLIPFCLDKKFDSYCLYLLTFAPLKESELNSLADEKIRTKYPMISNVLAQAMKLRNPSLTAAEKALREIINLKSLGHFMGDQYLNELRSSNDEKLEGDSPARSSLFVIRLLEHFLEKYNNRLTDEQKISLQKSIKGLQGFHEASLDIEHLFRMDLLQADQLKNFGSKWTKKLKSLKEGESLTLPTGWCAKSRNDTGHAMLMELTRFGDDVSIRVYDTSTAIGFREYVEDPLKPHIRNIRHYRMSLNDFEQGEFVRTLIEPKIANHSTFQYKTENKEYDATTIYSILEPYGAGEDEISSEDMLFWMVPQYSGTCSMRCLFAWLKKNLGVELNKEFKTLSMIDVSTFAVEDSSLSLKNERPLRMILQRTSANVFRKIGKEASTIGFNEEDYKSAEELSKALQQALANQITDIKSNYVSPSEISQSKISKKKCGNKSGTWVREGGKKEAAASAIPRPPTIKTSFDSWAEYRDYLDALTKYAETASWVDSNALLVASQGLKNLSTFIVSAQFEKTLLFKSLDDSTREIVTEQLKTLANKVYSLSAHTHPRIANSLALNYAYVACWKLLSSHSKMGKIAQMPPDYERIKLSLTQCVGSTILSPDECRDVNTLLAQIKNYRGLPTLFQPQNMLEKVTSGKQAGSVYLIRPTLQEEKFASNFHSKEIIEQVEKEIDTLEKEIRASIREYISKAPSNEYTRAGEENLWIKIKADYKNLSLYSRLPEAYKNLRSLALMAHSQSSVKSHPSIDIERLKPLKPFLRQDSNSENPPSVVLLRGNEISPSGDLIKEGDSLLKAFSVPSVNFRNSKDQAAFKEFIVPKETDISLLDEYDEDDPSSTFAVTYRAQSKEKAENELIRRLDQKMRPHGFIQTLATLKASNTARIDDEYDSSPLGIYLAIDNYRKDFESLRERTQQFFMQRNVFLSHHFGLELATHPELGQQALAFFDQAIRHFQRSLEGNIQLKSSCQTLTFLYSEKMRLLAYMKAFKPTKEIDQFINASKIEIKQFENDKRFQEPEFQQRLLYALLLPFEAETALSPKEAIELLTTMTKFQRISASISPANQYLSMIELDHAKNCMIKFSKTIEFVLEKAIKENPSNLDPILETYGLKISDCDSLQIESPLLKMRLKNGNQATLNFYDGMMAFNGNAISGLPLSVITDNMFLTFIKGIKYSTTAQMSEDYSLVEGEDALGEFRISFDPRFAYQRSNFGSVQGIQRKFNGEWYTYSMIRGGGGQSYEPPQVELGGINEEVLHLQSETPPRKIIFAQQEGSRLVPLYTLWNDPDEKMKCIFGSSSVVYTNVERPDDSFISQFSHEASVWTTEPGNPNSESLLIFPKHQTTKGEPLIFKSSIVKNKEKEELKWVFEGEENLFIASEQKLKGLPSLKDVIIVQNKRGQNFAMIPDSSIRSKREKCLLIELVDGWLNPKTPEESTFAALITLHSATGPEDYKRSMGYLKKAQSFQGFSKQTIHYLNAILDSTKVKPDNSVEADAVRLYAAWLLQNNIKQNPDIAVEINKEEIQKTNKKLDEVENRLKDKKIAPSSKFQLTSIRDRLRHKKNALLTERNEIVNQALSHVSKTMEELLPNYFRRYNQLDIDLRLTSHVSEMELTEWQIANHFRPFSSQGLQHNYVVRETTMKLEHFIDLLQEKIGRSPTFRTGPGKSIDLRLLLREAQHENPEIRRKLRLWALQMVADKFFLPVRNILLALIAAKDALQQGKAVNASDHLILELVRRLPEQLTISKRKEGAYNQFASDLFEAARFYHPDVPRTQFSSKIPKFKEPDVEAAVGSRKPQRLPELPPKKELITTESLPANSLHNERLKVESESIIKISSSSKQVEMSPFRTPKGLDNYLEDSIRDLNKDYQKGNDKNKKISTFELKASQKELSSLYSAKADLLKEQESSLKKLEKSILDLANQLPNDPRKAYIEKNKRKGGQSKSLTIDDCILLYQQDHLPLSKQHTFLSNEDIVKLHTLIGKYMIASLERDETKELVRALKGVDNPATFEKLDKFKLAQILGSIYSNEQHFDYNDTANFAKILLTFQYYLNLRLRKHQVEGLKKMLATENGRLRLEKWLLQRIQGGGKSLVFGHILAMAKADGYHLSVHVAPTPQYATSLYDMRAMSGRIYRQKERTFTFDDSPLKYTPEYLRRIKSMFVQAVNSREYVTITKETLQAMRCKYIKQRLLLNNRYNQLNISAEMIRKIQGGKRNDIPGVTPKDAIAFAEEEERLALLEDLLHTLRERGVFTFDEIQMAFNPKVVLNMPYGLPLQPKNEEISLISQILIFANTAQDASGRRLLKIEKNEQSQQTETDYDTMIEFIIQRVVTDPKTVKDLGIDQLNADQINVLKDYLKSENADIPSFISQRIPGKESSWILLRMLLGGKWIKDRLKLSINEHSGLAEEKRGPDIAVPFDANMDPAVGSEFSSIYVTLINTMLSFIVKGLNPDQISLMIKTDLKAAVQEHEKRSRKEPKLLLSDTDIAQKFKARTGFSLFLCDPTDSELLKKIESKLKDGSSGSIEFLVDYMRSNVFNEVTYYPKLIASNGQNVASMGTFVGYSGSFDNLFISPVGSQLDLEEGTNGQTIDRLISQNDDVWVTPTDPGESLDLLLTQHPNSAQIRSYIDIGCHFRGFKNKEAAEIIAGRIKQHNPTIKAVIFFDQKGNLCSMSVNHPKIVHKLSGTRPEVIAAETDLEVDELFFYYDQKHITGIDFVQAPDTYAVASISEHTKIHEVLQGARRMRGLDFLQHVIPVVQKSALHKLTPLLGKDFANVNTGHPKEGDLNVKDLLLYAHLNEKISNRDENEIVVCQKLNDLAAQCLLDKAYLTRDWALKRELFNKAEPLLAEEISIDLKRQYGALLVDEDKIKFLEDMRKQLLGVLVEAGIDQNDVGRISKVMEEEVIQKMIAFLKNKIKIAKGDSSVAIQQMNMESTMTQFREQQQETEQVQQQEQESEDVSVKKQVMVTTQQLDSSIIEVDHLRMTKDEFKSMRFLTSEALNKAGNELKSGAPNLSYYAYKLSDVLMQQLGSQSKNAEGMAALFGPNVLVSRNLIQTYEGRIDLLTPQAKPQLATLLIYDQKDTLNPYKILLCSPLEAALWKNYLEEQEVQEAVKGQGKLAWIMTPTLNQTNEGMGSLKDHLNQNPAPAITSALQFFVGLYDEFEDEKKLKGLQSWLDSPGKLESARVFLETYILKPLPNNYFESALHTALQSSPQTEMSA